MSLILPSSAASTPPGKPSSNTAIRHNEQEQNEPVSFGEVLSRSLAPAGEPAEKTSCKPVTSTSARRQEDDRKVDPQDLVNAMALALVSPESKAVPSAPGGTAPAVGGTATDPGGAAAALLTGLVANAQAPADGASAGTGAQTVLTPGLSLASPKDGGQTTLQAARNAASGSSVMALVAGKIAAQASAPDTGTSDQSSPGDAKAGNKPDAMNTESASFTPVVNRSASKVSVTATTAAPGAEAAALTITDSPAPGANTFSPSAALPINPALAATPGPIGISAANTPAAVTTASLAPEVGSSEWGKALGQQVSHMGNAGHQVAELQLNPPGLGPLKVTLSMNDNQIQAMFVSAHASVRAAVEAALPQLRASLADNGISLGNTSVSAGNQQQAAFAQSQNGSSDQRSYRDNRLPGDTASLVPRMIMEPLRQNNGITVDTYA